MNFFEHQEKAKKKTTLLVFYFLLAMVLIILIVDVVVAGAVLLSGDMALISTIVGSEVPTRSYGYGYPSEIIITLPLFLKIAGSIGLLVAPCIIAIIGLGSLFRFSQLSAGGISVANLSGAVPIEPDTKDPLEKRFMNVVEEMSIASGVPIPKLYVMKEENSLNAFVAGIKPEDTVMVVTQGALNTFSRDELQGVVGHEFSHIFNSDMKISVRLIGILAGILLLGQLGWFLLRSLSYSRPRSRSKGDKSIFIMLALGIALFLVGYIGLFFGRLIKAAISRQRELLADASSLQYTREPTGLINALKRIQASNEGSVLKSKHAEDISHLCFSPSMNVLFSTLLATHPKIEDRIKALDSEGIYSQQDLSKKRVPSPDEKTDQSKSSNEKWMAGMVILATGAMQTQAKNIKDSIGTLSQKHIQLAQNLINDLSPTLVELAHDIQQVELLLYGLLLPEPKENQDKAAAILDLKMVSQVFEVYEQIKGLNNTQILPLVDLALPSFKANDLTKRQSIFQNMEKIAACQPNDLFHFTLLSLVGKMVEDKKPPQGRYDRLDLFLNDLSILMSKVIHYSHPNPIDAAEFYPRVMRMLTTQNIPYPPINEFQPMQLKLVLTRLNQLNFTCKEKVITACLACIEDNGKIDINEAQIVRAIAACLDCPIPPILPTE